VRFPDASIKLDEGAAYPGLETPADAPVVKQAQALADRVGTIKVPFGTEAGFFAGLGIPTVVCGPGSMEGQGHKPDEFLRVDQLAACDAMLERLIDTLV
jgi:acetylornithine deacetylase